MQVVLSMLKTQFIIFFRSQGREWILCFNLVLAKSLLSDIWLNAYKLLNARNWSTYWLKKSPGVLVPESDHVAQLVNDDAELVAVLPDRDRLRAVPAFSHKRTAAVE